MNYGKIIYDDVANGPGCRTSLFVSGCRRHCKGCFNEETWDFGYGKPYTRETKWEILGSLANTYTDGLSVLGGEPLDPDNVMYVGHLCACVKQLLKDKTVWVYTGYKYEEIPEKAILQYIDVLVDGPFIEEKKDLRLQFRGSSNQRIIDVQKSLKKGEVVLWDGLKSS